MFSAYSFTEDESKGTWRLCLSVKRTKSLKERIRLHQRKTAGVLLLPESDIHTGLPGGDKQHRLST